MPAVMYRSTKGPVRSTGALSYIVDHGALTPAIGSNRKYFLSPEGVGVEPLVLVGSYQEIMNYFDADRDIQIVNQVDVHERRLFVSVSVFRPGNARFQTVSAVTTVINSIVGFATGSILPGSVPVARIGAHVVSGIAGSASELASSLARVSSGGSASSASSSASSSAAGDEIGQGQTFAVRFDYHQSSAPFSFATGNEEGVTTFGNLRIPVQITIQQVLGM